jgi:hypothetical protein
MRTLTAGFRQKLAATAMLAAISVLVIGCSDDRSPLQSSSQPTRVESTSPPVALTSQVYPEGCDEDRDWSQLLVTMRELLMDPEQYDGRRIAIIGEPSVFLYSCELGFCWPYPCCVQCLGWFGLTEVDPQGETVALELRSAGDEFWYCAGSRCAFEGDENYEFDSYPFPRAYDNGTHWFGGIFRDETPANYPWRVWRLYVEDYGPGSYHTFPQPPRPPKFLDSHVID